MGVNVQAQGKGGITLGGNLDFSQLGGTGSPAVVSTGLFIVLLAIVIVIAMSAR